MVRRCIRIRRSTTRLREPTRPARPSRSALASPWARSGAAAAGAGTPAGDTTTSTSTTTTISTETANINVNRNGSVRNNVGAGNTWQHQPEHRGGAPYSDRATANRYGGAARGDSLANRQTQARQQINRQGGQVAQRRSATRGASAIAGGRRSRRSRGGTGNRPGGAGGIGNQRRAESVGLAIGRAAPDRVGQRDLSRGGGNPGAFGGGGARSFDGAGARASSSRGSSSISAGSRGGGGCGGGGGGARRRRWRRRTEVSGNDVHNHPEDDAHETIRRARSVQWPFVDRLCVSHRRDDGGRRGPAIDGSQTPATPAASVRTFDSPQQAVDALGRRRRSRSTWPL